MHILYFVILDQEDAADSRKARNAATNILIEENFCYESGFFSSAKADGFTVGGGWSGILQLMKIGITEKDFSHLSEHDREICWAEHGGNGPCPWAKRSMCGTEEYDDDAMIVTEELYRKLVEEYPDTEVYDANLREEMVVCDMKSKDVMNRWIVVVDYHS